MSIDSNLAWLAKSWLIGKDSDAGRDWGQEEKGTTEDEMAGWHHWIDGHESEWAPGVGDGQGGLTCCDSWCRKESDTTERLIWSDLIWNSCRDEFSYSKALHSISFGFALICTELSITNIFSHHTSWSSFKQLQIILCGYSITDVNVPY